MGGECSMYVHERHEKCIQSVSRKLEINRRLERLRNKWEDNVKMDLT